MGQKKLMKCGTKKHSRNPSGRTKVYEFTQHKSLYIHNENTWNWLLKQSKEIPMNEFINNVFNKLANENNTGTIQSETRL